MHKFTRRIKKNRKNRTIKTGGYGGSKSDESEKEERQGVIDMVQDKIGDVAKSAATGVADVGLRLVGLQRVGKEKEEEPKPEPPQEVNENLQKIESAASGILDDVKDVADKTGAAIVDNVNEVLGSKIVDTTTTEAAEQTAEIVKDNLEKFNDALNKPEVKAEVKEALDNAGEVGSLVIDASKKPFYKAVDVAAETIPKVSNAVVTGVARVGTDFLAALPGIGAIFDIGKIINDSTRAASSVVEASSEAVEAASDSFIEAKHLVEEGIKELGEKKELANKISDRTTESIKEFENPTKSTTGGRRKTKRRLNRRKAKSKRVRFAF